MTTTEEAPIPKLYDALSGDTIGDATPEQVAETERVQAEGNDTGIFLIDADGAIRQEGDDEAVYGPLRSVYVL